MQASHSYLPGGLTPKHLPCSCSAGAGQRPGFARCSSIFLPPYLIRLPLFSTSWAEVRARRDSLAIVSTQSHGGAQKHALSATQAPRPGDPQDWGQGFAAEQLEWAEELSGRDSPATKDHVRHCSLTSSGLLWPQQASSKQRQFIAI